MAGPDEGRIRFRSDPYEKADDGKVLHLKGFASRIEMDSDEARELSGKLLSFVVEEAPAEIVWDGDGYAPGSFTQLLPDLVAACGAEGKVRLVAFLREPDQQRFLDSWLPESLPITVYLQDAAIDFTELGGIALRATQSKVVACFGGGAVVRDEFAKISEALPGVAFHLFPVSRPTADGSGTEESSLLALRGAPSLVVH
mmetsp:Transcript_110825/g.345415  ORF Transcript_110825/g.345415 Transcript_110825/m.345415 type:complete len:199 (+) Transcript_110825:46-642(+)|eukprot:CAMPEP_0204577180 /NCGR_PEP_ID=MMETSP0661-20131031/42194_1 /ASSEMBLY_ACC=CAM_ASM_000606 /TAXON_ID=109239 /ORGANISM="Alexandrium margalefi, Strain AMGDE01CS-322" /LENGTH=198 /DNA_ID=CAMNT_0051585983 /DNA_START=44 /DNA_END=640 /DNA_ORIENTATION=-